MPFPLAHPAAVLPLRRYCPRLLSFPALVIGSLTPDAGYLFGEGRGGAFSHRLLGSIAFCLPLGLVLVALFYGLRAPMVRMLSAPYQRKLISSTQRPFGSPWVVVISLLIGAWTHLLWDSFTHSDGWCVQHLPLLHSPLIIVGSRTARICHLLWYGSSFVGMIWLFLVFEKWKQACVNAGAAAPTRAVLRDAVLVALLVLPIELAHHLVRGRPGLYLMAGLCALPVIGIGLRLGVTRKGATADKAAAGGRDTI